MTLLTSGKRPEKSTYRNLRGAHITIPEATEERASTLRLVDDGIYLLNVYATSKDTIFAKRLTKTEA